MEVSHRVHRQKQSYRVTLVDVARQAKVSPSVVSVVLGQRPNTNSTVRVSEATRTRVRNVARELQYQPNALARSLRARRTNLIGFYSGYHFLDPRNSFFAEIIGGLQAGCAQHGKDLLLHTVFRGDSGDDVADIFAELVDGRIDGLVMTAPTNDPLAERLADYSLPVIAVADFVPSLPSLSVDDAHGAALMLDYLLERGHTRLAFLYPNRHLSSAERRRITFSELARAKGVVVQESQVAEEDPAALADYLTEWRRLAASQKPTVIWCWNDKTAYSLIAGCHRQGISVPDELSVAGFDGCHNPLAFHCQLTTIQAPWFEVAKAAVELVTHACELGEKIAGETIFPVSIVQGDTA